MGETGPTEDVFRAKTSRKISNNIHLEVLQGLVPNPGLKEAQDNDYLERRCNLPKINHRSRKGIQTLKENSFQVNGPNLFNSLRNMKQCTSDDFKMELDKHLQMMPDQPKTDGLIPWGQDMEGEPSTSILHQAASCGGPGRA